MSSHYSLPREAASCFRDVVQTWKNSRENIASSCFCGGILSIAIEHNDGRTYATVIRKNTLIGCGESYIVRKEVNLPSEFGTIWNMVGHVLWPENIETKRPKTDGRRASH